MVISKESNLSGIVNCSGLHIKVGPTNRRRIGDLDVPFIDLAGANDDATLGDATAHDRAEGNLIRIIDIRYRTNGDRRSVLEPEALSAKAGKRSASRRGIAERSHLCDHAVVPHEQVAVDRITNRRRKEHNLSFVVNGAWTNRPECASDRRRITNGGYLDNLPGSSLIKEQCSS